MNAFQRLVSGEGFIKMVVTIIFWLVIYVIVKFMTYKAGLNDLLKHANNMVLRMGRLSSSLESLCSSKPGPQTQKAIKMYKRVVKCQWRTSKIMAMYLFDDKHDKDVAGAKTMVETVPNLCKTAVSSLVDKERHVDIHTIFEEVKSNLKTASDLIAKAQKLDEKKEMLQV